MRSATSGSSRHSAPLHRGEFQGAWADAGRRARAKSRRHVPECAQVCPEMVVIPAGEFWMGSPVGQGNPPEYPRRKVKIDRPFAVGKFEVTWDDWDACVAMRGCDGRPTGDSAFGKGRRPVINVSWDQAKAYVAWLSRMTGKTYRLLT